MKNLRTSALFLCALIACSPIQTNAFSLKTITDSIKSFGNQVWKKIQNNPGTTAGIIGTSTLLVATIIAAKKSSQTRKPWGFRRGNDSWNLYFNRDRWMPEIRYEHIPSRPSTPDSNGSTSNTDIELNSVSSNQTRRQHTPPTQPGNRRQFAFRNNYNQTDPVFPSAQADDTSATTIGTTASQNSVITMRSSQNNSGTESENNFVALACQDKQPGGQIGGRKQRKNSRLAQCLVEFSDSDDDQPDQDPTSSNPFVTITQSPTPPLNLARSNSEGTITSRNSFDSSISYDLPDNLDNFGSNRFGSIRSKYSNLSKNPYVDHISPISSNGSQGSKHRRSKRLSTLAKNSLGGSIGSTNRHNGSMRHNTNKNPMPTHAQPTLEESIALFNSKFLQKGVGTSRQYSFNWATGTPRRKRTQELGSPRKNPTRSSIDISRAKNPNFIVFNIETIKNWMNVQNENALLKMQLANDLQKYPNLAELVEKIKLFIFNNRCRMDQLGKVALDGDAMRLQQNLRPLVGAIGNCRAYGHNPSLDKGLIAWLSTLAKNPKTLLSDVPSTRSNEQSLTLIEHLYKEYDKSSLKHFAIQQRLSDVNWLYDKKTKTQKRKKLKGFLAKIRKSNSDPTGFQNQASSSSNGKLVNGQLPEDGE